MLNLYYSVWRTDVKTSRTHNTRIPRRVSAGLITEIPTLGRLEICHLKLVHAVNNVM